MKSGCTSKAGMESAQPETKEWMVWEKSAENFVDLFLGYLNRQGLEIRFKQPII